MNSTDYDAEHEWRCLYKDFPIEILVNTKYPQLFRYIDGKRSIDMPISSIFKLMDLQDSIRIMFQNIKEVHDLTL